MIFLGIIFLVIFSIIVGTIGSNRKIGFGGAFFLSLFLSPLIGLIFTLISKTNETVINETELITIQKEQQKSLNKLKNENINGATESLNNIKSLLDKGIINNEEFEKMKSKVMSSFEDDTNIKSESKEQGTKNIKGVPKYYVVQNGTESSFFGGLQSKYRVDFEDGVFGDFFSKGNGKYRINSNNTNVYYPTFEACIKGLYHFSKTNN